MWRDKNGNLSCAPTSCLGDIFLKLSSSGSRLFPFSNFHQKMLDVERLCLTLWYFVRLCPWQHSVILIFKASSSLVEKHLAEGSNHLSQDWKKPCPLDHEASTLPLCYTRPLFEILIGWHLSMTFLSLACSFTQTFSTPAYQEAAVLQSAVQVLELSTAKPLTGAEL